MSSDVIIGYHGKPRCAWAGAGDTAFGRYHDEVWGTRTYDEPAMFEALTLGVFEVGLSWSIVFGKRDAFRTAFRGFDVANVAAMTGQDVDRLMEDASIIRNRGKIQATVDNARAMDEGTAQLTYGLELGSGDQPITFRRPDPRHHKEETYRGPSCAAASVRNPHHCPPSRRLYPRPGTGALRPRAHACCRAW